MKFEIASEESPDLDPKEVEEACYEAIAVIEMLTQRCASSIIAPCMLDPKTQRRVNRAVAALQALLAGQED